MGVCGVVIVATVLPYIFYTKGLEGVESGRASIITNIEPVVETLVGVFVFKAVSYTHLPFPAQPWR